MSLQTPYSLFGLGRTNNYVEVGPASPSELTQSALTNGSPFPPQNLFVGSTLRADPHFTSIEGIIPNSQVVVSPPTVASAGGSSSSWRWRLYLHPSDFVPWVSIFVVLTTLALCGVVTMLHRREQVRLLDVLLARRINADVSAQRRTPAARGRGRATAGSARPQLLCDVIRWDLDCQPIVLPARGQGALLKAAGSPRVKALVVTGVTLARAASVSPPCHLLPTPFPSNPTLSLLIRLSLALDHSPISSALPSRRNLRSAAHKPHCRTLRPRWIAGSRRTRAQAPRPAGRRLPRRPAAAASGPSRRPSRATRRTGRPSRPMATDRHRPCHLPTRRARARCRPSRQEGRRRSSSRSRRWRPSASRLTLPAARPTTARARVSSYSSSRMVPSSSPSCSSSRRRRLARADHPPRRRCHQAATSSRRSTRLLRGRRRLRHLRRAPRVGSSRRPLAASQPAGAVTGASRPATAVMPTTRAARTSITGSPTSARAGVTIRLVLRAARVVGARSRAITRIRRALFEPRAAARAGRVHTDHRQTRRRRAGSELRVRRARRTISTPRTALRRSLMARRATTRSLIRSTRTSTTRLRRSTRHRRTQPSRPPRRGPTHRRHRARTTRAVARRRSSRRLLRRSTATRTAPLRPTRTRAPGSARPRRCRTRHKPGRPTRPIVMRRRPAPSTAARPAAPAASRSRARLYARSTQSTISTASGVRCDLRASLDLVFSFRLITDSPDRH